LLSGAAWCISLSDDLTTKAASELKALIRSRAVSPVEVAEAYLKRVEAKNPRLNAIVTVADDVIEQARAAEIAIMSDGLPSPLHGLPVTIKDTIDTAGLRTTSGTLVRSNHIPNQDAAAVARLKAAGAIILGKTNTPEMAIPYETANPIFGRTNNPYDLQKTCGGSSGGEAAAIAAGLSAAGVGSDLSGSIRVPAHFCGIVGLKPTTDRVPMGGHTPAASGPLSLGACIGPMARTVADVNLLFEILSGGQTAARPRENLRGLRVGVYLSDGVTPVSAETSAAIEVAADALKNAHLEVEEVLPPGVSEASRMWIELFSRAVANQIRDFYRDSEDKAGPLVASILETIEDEASDMAAKIDRAEALARALIERERRREELLRWMKTTPVILAPVGSVPAFAHGTKRVRVGLESISVFRAFSYSQAFNVFGLPAISVPAGRTAEGLPIGVQIIGQPNDEETVLSAAAIVEHALGGWRRPPEF
jgi:Asp-tRNA(Asn)/Glu-tRNA(Gln) amidotransferase A subunit family amidase